jgi:ricin-type beta-trefoil lectin protein
MKRTCGLVGGLAAVWLAGCDVVPEVEDDGQSDVVETVGSPLYKGGNVWPFNDYGVREMPVCFTAESIARADFTTVRDRIQRSLNLTWGAVASITFTGFGSCGSTENGKARIRIDEPDVGSGAQIGYQGASRPTTAHLRSNVDQGVIAHEFGHLLGFEHEFARADWEDPPGCHAQKLREGGDTLGTPANETESIMVASGYCQYNQWLSAWDIVGVQNLYGRKKAGSIVGLENRCLDIPGGTPSVGEDLQVYNCKGANNQLWRRTAASQLYAPTWGHAAYLDVGGDEGNRAPVQAYPENVPLTDNQTWTFENAELRGMGNLCIAPDSFANQQVLRLAVCDGSDNQKWTFPPNGKIEHGSWCVDVSSSTGLMQVYSCHNGANQRFTFTAAGEIKYGDRCIQVLGDRPTVRGRLTVGACKSDSDLSRMSQRFHISGEIRSLGRCLDIRGGTSFNGAAAQIYDCKGASNQRWDYYFNP